MTRPAQTFTVDDVLNYGPCPEYTRERLEVLFAGRSNMTFNELLAVNIPYRDKIYCMLSLNLIAEDIKNEMIKFAKKELKVKASNPSNEGYAKHCNDLIDKVKNDTTLSCLEVLVLAQKEDRDPEFPKEQRISIMEAVAQTQLSKLLELLDA